MLLGVVKKKCFLGFALLSLCSEPFFSRRAGHSIQCVNPVDQGDSDLQFWFIMILRMLPRHRIDRFRSQGGPSKHPFPGPCPNP